MDRILSNTDIIISVLIPVIGFTVWLIRQEGLNKLNADKIKTLREDFKANRDKVDSELSDIHTRITNIDSDLMKQIANVRESLARIEGALGISKK